MRTPSSTTPPPAPAFRETTRSPVILVGVDGQPQSDAALQVAAWLSEALSCGLVLAAVYRVKSQHPSRTAERRSRDEADLVLTRDRARVPGCRTRLVAARSAVEGLRTVAEEEDAGVVVVGASHRGALGRLLSGGTPQRLVHDPRRPVLVVPDHAPDVSGRSIAVAYDASRAADAALALGVELARATGQPLVIWHVHAAGGRADAPAYDDFRAALRRTAERTLGRAMTQIPDELGAAGELHDGFAPKVVPELCDRQRPGLLLVGAHGYGGDLWLGETSRRLVDEVPCPVAIVPADPRA